jgi:hypothetical protein
MKRWLAFLLAILIGCAGLAACSEGNEESFGESVGVSSEAISEVRFEESSAESSMEDSSAAEESSQPEEPNDPVLELEGFRLSSIDDVTGEDGKRVYTVHAPYTDTYSLVGDGVKEMTLLQDGEEVASGTELSVELTQYAVYTLEVETEEAGADFTITTKAENHLVTLPYDVPERNEPIEYDVYGNDKLTAAEVNYIKRKGGTYIYSNNPEQFGAQHVGKAFMRNEGLTGEVYVTFEHANYSGNNVYLGYQLKNNTDHDVYITITNVGYQWIGTWFGQLMSMPQIVAWLIQLDYFMEKYNVNILS